LHLNPKGQPQARDVTLVETSPLEVADSISPTSLLLDLGDWEPLPDEAPLRIQSGTHSNSVRICSWNILAVAYANCKAFPDVEPALLAWDRRRALVARALEMMNADVVCLQEVDRPLEDLGLQEYDQVRAQRPDGRADGCTIAWKRGSFTLVNEEVISFDDHLGLDHDQQRFRRGNCAAIAELRRSSSKGERSFLVATTHLCWEADSEDIRQQQANVLLTALEARSRRLGPRTVLCGDLNAMPGCLSHRTITNALPSVYRDLEAEDAVTNSNASAGPAVIHGDDIPGGRENGSRGEASKEKQGFAGMLDYLCMDARGAKVSSRLRLPGRPELRDKLGQGAEGPLPTLLCASWPSDHLPVAADVNFAVVFQ
jgi:endonuclease/exonuclease/phosphatase family metal-dependent hydrolase